MYCYTNLKQQKDTLFGFLHSHVCIHSLWSCGCDAVSLAPPSSISMHAPWHSIAWSASNFTSSDNRMPRSQERVASYDACLYSCGYLATRLQWVAGRIDEKLIHLLIFLSTRMLLCSKGSLFLITPQFYCYNYAL